MDETGIESIDPQGQRADEVGVAVEVTEGVEGVVGEPPAPAEAVPQSPTSSIPFSDTAYPPSSDAGIETTDVENPVASGDEGRDTTVGANQSCRFAKQPRKRVKDSNDEGDQECQPARKWRKKRARESDDDLGSGEDRVLSRSAEVSQKLKEAVRSGTFVVDQEKRGRFEKKCRGLDGHAKFNYKGSWQVRHSKCSKWVKMQEPYNLARFGEHTQGCKRMGEKGRDGTIDLFFKKWDAKETGTTRIAQPSARKQIVAGASAKLRGTLIKRDPPSIPFLSNKWPCLGLREDQDERIGRYISRVIVEGAGSHSDTHVARELFGAKYSTLNTISKHYVAAAQVHSQKWKISHALGAVFSADCKEKVIIMNETQSPACDQCLGLLKLDNFKKALNIQPPPLENLKS